MDEPDTVPNWFESAILSKAGLMKSDTTKSSATLESDAVSEIGLSSFLGSTTCFTFGSGVTSACFQTDGNFCSLYDELRMSALGWYSSSAYSFKN